LKKVLFRADAFPAIGTGDLISSINLAAEFEERCFQTHFFVKDYPASLKIIESRRVERCRIASRNATLEDELAEMDDYMSRNGIELLVLQLNERRDTDYRPLIRKYRTVTINFNGITAPEVGIVINWDSDTEGLFDRNVLKNAKFLLGPEYVILPGKLIETSFQAPRRVRPAGKILIAMGGADELDFTGKIVREFIKSGNNQKLNIVLGAGYSERAGLEKLLEKSGVEYELKINIPDMLAEYMECGYALGAGGLTAYELVTTGTPCYLLALYEHQIGRCSYFHKKGWAQYLGYRPELKDFGFEAPGCLAGERFRPRLYDELFKYL